MQSLRPASLITASALFACTPLAEDEHDEHDEHETEIISRVELRFMPQDGSVQDPLVASFSDPDGDGGVSGTAEPIVLEAGVSYSLGITLLNELEDPIVDISEEIAAEAEEHMFFVAEQGGLLSVDYNDLESDYGDNAVGEDLPVGLSFAVTANSAGSSQLRVILRHLPELNGVAQKSADLVESFAAGEALPGDVDVDVSFELTVI